MTEEEKKELIEVESKKIRKFLSLLIGSQAALILLSWGIAFAIGRDVISKNQGQLIILLFSIGVLLFICLFVWMYVRADKKVMLLIDGRVIPDAEKAAAQLASPANQKVINAKLWGGSLIFRENEIVHIGSKNARPHSMALSDISQVQLYNGDFLLKSQKGSEQQYFSPSVLRIRMNFFSKHDRAEIRQELKARLPIVPFK